ncbi:hypothetical protein GGR54DRAFT_637171 [Hypoxylon sp. NC1633]|nr:hypothetical protein GGR54DRAFT_637171 [Hypoxylon sp. NC1633]
MPFNRNDYIRVAHGTLAVNKFVNLWDPPNASRPSLDGGKRAVELMIQPSFPNGAAFIGPLPQDVQRVIVLDQSGAYAFNFRNVGSGNISFHDARLESWPLDLDGFREQLEELPWAKICVDPKVLKERGVELRYFDLV